MTELRKCSRCRSDIKIKHVGINRKGEPYNTCDTCRNNDKHIKVKQEVCKVKTCLDYYINHPIFKFENKQDIDIHIYSIVVLNHNVEFHNNIIFRSDGEAWKYKEFTQLDPVDYYEGTDRVKFSEFFIFPSFTITTTYYVVVEFYILVQHYN